MIDDYTYILFNLFLFQTQHIIGGRGVYNQTNIENRKEYSLTEWKELCQRSDHRPPKTASANVKSTKIASPNETTDLTIDQYKDIERHYWRNVTFHQPMYGADLLGSKDFFFVALQHIYIYTDTFIMQHCLMNRLLVGI